jgi:hypothetical protein
MKVIKQELYTSNKRKLLKIETAIQFNKGCTCKGFVPVYADIKIKGNIIHTYCNVYHRFYATIASGNMRCLITAGKHVNDTRAIARQLLGKRVPVATDMHATVEVLLDYNNRNGAFSEVRAEML